MARVSTILVVVLLAVAAVAGCKKPAQKVPAPDPPSYDKRELAALKGAGKGIPDGGPADDTGVHVPDTTAALFDEALCKEACGHLYEILTAEQKEKLAKEPESLAVFLEELERIRPQRERKCVRQCRKYADLRAVDCVKAATTREQLDGCDF